MITLEEFAELVAQMRAAQLNYFRTRSDQALHDSKGLEKRVDAAVAEVMGTLPPSLFDGTYETPPCPAGKKAERVPNQGEP